MNRSMPGLPVHHQLLELAQTHVHQVGDAVQSSHLLSPLLLPSSIFLNIRVFSNESTLRIRWPKYWSFSFSIIPSKEIPGLISFRMELVRSPCSPRDSQESSPTPQLKVSILRCSAFFILQLSHPYMTTEKTIALTRWTIVGKVMSLLCNMLSRFVIVFLPRSKHLLISWLQSPSAVILEPQKIMSVTVSIVSPSICHEVMGLDARILVFCMLNLSQLFHSTLSFSSRGSLVLCFFHKGGVFCIFEVIDISPSNLDSSLCFLQPGISHDVFCVEVK